MSFGSKQTSCQCDNHYLTFRRPKNLILRQNSCMQRKTNLNSSTIRNHDVLDHVDIENPLRKLSAAINEQSTSNNQPVIALYEDASRKSKYAILAAAEAAKVSRRALKTAAAVKSQKESALETLRKISNQETSSLVSAGTRTVLASVKKLALMQAHSASEQEVLAAKVVESAIIEQQVSIGKALSAIRKEHIVFAATARAMTRTERGNCQKKNMQRRHV